MGERYCTSIACRVIGGWSQRAMEYPWVIESLRFVPRGGLILDVGCAESLLSHELIARGFRVVGIDIRDYPFKDNRMLFLKRNIMDTCLSDSIFDAILIVSTIEHVGLESYGQTVKDTDGDLRAMNEFTRILKHHRDNNLNNTIHRKSALKGNIL